MKVLSVACSICLWALLMAVAPACHPPNEKNQTVTATDSAWTLPNPDTIRQPTVKKLVTYGKELVVHTAAYLGPQGTVAHLTNGMACQNCHLQAGGQLYGNPFLTVAATYPKFSPRSGATETIERKVNDCMERSLNGRKLDSGSLELKAMVAYIKFTGDNLPPDVKPAGNGTLMPALLNRAANAATGRVLYSAKCVQCHGADGGGIKAPDSTYTYPPLWGPHSYNVSAGIFRLTKLAGFIKNNMPYGVTYKAPQLTNEEAWDLAAFINSQPRPQKKFATDWPVLIKKPMDYPFGPYADAFAEERHKYGPYQQLTAPDKAINKK